MAPPKLTGYSLNEMDACNTCREERYWLLCYSVYLKLKSFQLQQSTTSFQASYISRGWPMASTFGGILLQWNRKPCPTTLVSAENFYYDCSGSTWAK